MTDGTLFDVDETLTVGQVNRRISRAIGAAFPHDLWVQGQIRNLSKSARGHVYFDLIDPVEAGATPKASISVTLFDSSRQIVNRIITRTGNTMRVEDGVEVRIRATTDFYSARGQVQLVMSSIDPEYTLGRLGADRDRLLEQLRTEAVLDANRQHDLALVPLRIGLVTSEGSAAYADFTREISQSGYAFEITVFDTRVQGEFAGEEIAGAIAAASQADIDVLAIVRGGGARTDLAAFDTEAVARAVVGAPVPVICGIGHEIDTSVADLVAHTSVKTPTACAQALIGHVSAFDTTLNDLATRISERAPVVTERAAARVELVTVRTNARAKHALASAGERNQRYAEATRRLVSERLTGAQTGLTSRRVDMQLLSTRCVSRAQSRLNAAAERLRHRPLDTLRDHDQRIALVQAKLDAVDPVQALRRGWTITTTADGRFVRSIGDVSADSILTTRIADGIITSVVATATGTDRSDSATTDS